MKRRPESMPSIIVESRSHWRKAVRAFWAGENIYLNHEEASERISEGAGPEGEGKPRVWLHPNTPFTHVYYPSTTKTPSCGSMSRPKIFFVFSWCS